jgi:tetratricopeptide (TPR) repeat protein
MTSRLLPWTALLLVALAAAGGWFAWRATSDDDRPGGGGETPVVASAPAETDPRLRTAIGLVVEAQRTADPAARTAKAKEAIAKIVDVERARSGDPPELAFWRGLAAVLAGDDRETRSALERLRSTAKGGRRDARAMYLNARGVLAFETDKIDTALRLLRTLKSQAPQFMSEPVEVTLFESLRVAAGRHLSKRDPDGAASLLKEAVGLQRVESALRVDARRELARALGRAGRWMESRDEAAALLDLSKGTSLPDRYMVAVAHAAQHQWAPAVEHYSAVVAAIDSGIVSEPGASVLREAVLRRGNARRYLGDLEGAKADLERYVREVPDDGRGHYWLGNYYLDGLDDAKAAIPHFERARALLPWCEDPLRALVRVHEIQVPDPEKVAALKKELEEGAEARKKERERVAKERTNESSLCQ